MINQRTANRIYRGLLTAVDALEHSLKLSIDGIALHHVGARLRIKGIYDKAHSRVPNRRDSISTVCRQHIVSLIDEFERLTGFSVVYLWDQKRDSIGKVTELTVLADGGSDGDFQVL